MHVQTLVRGTIAVGQQYVICGRGAGIAANSCTRDKDKMKSINLNRNETEGQKEFLLHDEG